MIYLYNFELNQLCRLLETLFIHFSIGFYVKNIVLWWSPSWILDRYVDFVKDQPMNKQVGFNQVFSL